jgi:hypothetical protein
MRRFLIAGFLALGLVSTATPAARALDPDALRQDLIAGLNRGIVAYRTGPFLFTGVEAVAQGAAVRVKIADLTLPLPDRGGRIEFGDLAFTLADAPPGASPGASGDGAAGDRRYLVSEVTTASRATIVDDAGEKIALINYGLERLSGVWSTALRSFLDFDMAVDRFEVVVPEADLGFVIDRFTAVNQVAARGDGLTDWESEGRITGLRMIGPAVGTLRIGEILIDARVHGYDLAGMRAMNEALEEVGNLAPPPDRNRIAAFLERLERFSMVGQGFIERFKVTDVSYLDADRQPRLQLDEMEFDLAGGNLHLALGYGSLGLRMAGVRTILPGSAGDGTGDGAGNPLRALTPENLGLITSVERFPVRALWRSILKGILLGVAAGEQGPDTNAIGEAMGAEIMAAINDAGTVLRLDLLDVETPSGRLRAEGAFTVDPATAIGVRGGLDLTITGLDEMIAAATVAAQSGQVAPGVQGNMMFLMLLKGMVKREMEPDGETVDRLEIVVTPAGDVLFNGMPFSMAPRQ